MQSHILFQLSYHIVYPIFHYYLDAKGLLDLQYHQIDC